MGNIDLSAMKNALGIAAYMSALETINGIFEMDTADETSIRNLHHKMEILSKMDDESKGISYATEETSPCMKTANINKYDQHKSVMYMFAKIHAPFDIIITEYDVMMSYIFSDKDQNPRQSIFSIALTDALVEDDVDIIIPFIEFYIDEFNELDIRKICMEQIRRNYSNSVVGYLIHKGVIDEDARTLKASYEVNKFFTSSDQDWQTKYKSKYCQSKAVDKALAKDYESSMKFIRKHLYYDNPTDSTINVGIGDIISTVIYTAIEENSSDILREFLDNVEDDERFDKNEINETWGDSYEDFWIDAVIPRDDEDPTELINVINTWKQQHGFDMT